MSDTRNLTYIPFIPEEHGYGTLLEDYPGLSLTLLKDMSPAVKAFGRRGETYLKQLNTIHDILDNAWETPKATPPALLEDMKKFVERHAADLYPNYKSIHEQIKVEARPMMPFIFLNPLEMETEEMRGDLTQEHADLIINIVYSPNFNRSIGAYPDMPIIDFMNAFTHHSLYRDLLTRYRATVVYDKAYVAYCEKWGIPA